MILCNNFYQNRSDVRFAIVDFSQWEDIKITLSAHGPTFVVLRDGMLYYD